MNTTVVQRQYQHPSADVATDRRGTPISDADEPTAVGAEPSIDADAVRALVEMARSRRVNHSWLSPEHAYYRGVETAAEQALHPELASADEASWLDRHNPAFVSGYVETIALLTPAWSWQSDRTGRTP